MRNKGFTLVEILAVIVILGLLVTIATLSVTRIRKNADDKDRLYLHSALETSFGNFRTDYTMAGNPQVTSITIDDNMPSDFNRYISDLSYNGRHISKSDLEGTKIKLYKKGYALYNDEYTNDIINGIPNYSSLTEEQQFKVVEKQYIIDATCMVDSYVANPGQENASIEKYCKTNNHAVFAQDGLRFLSMSHETNWDVVPSEDELVCLKINYKGETLVDDFGKTPNALKFNNLCIYMSDEIGQK